MPSVGQRRRAALAATSAVILALALLTCPVARADVTSRKVQPRRSVPATAARAAPDTTGAIPAKGPVPPAVSDGETLPPPYTLPKVSRARMRACGHKWESMKQAGTTGDDIWRDFATKCLAAKADPTIAAGGLPPPSR